ncbi:MAG: hypothetical protein IJZ45_05525 [Bacteroidaceae bacterium]|nr:hypothetical protein [Bacteroidaceae bacterium]
MKIQKTVFSSPTAVGLETNSCRTLVGQLFIGWSDSCPPTDKQLFVFGRRAVCLFSAVDLLF